MTFLVEAVGTGKKTTGGVRPAFVIVTPCFQGLGREVFRSWIIIDDGDRPLRTGELIVVNLIVLGVSQIDL